jgi:voltage-gated potassium channel Kch
MGFKAWVVSMTCAEDVSLIQDYVAQMKGPEFDIAFINDAVVFERDNRFPAGTVAMLMTVDRADLDESIAVECGLTTFRGVVEYISGFATGRAKMVDGRAYFKVEGTRPALTSVPEKESDFFDALRAIFD